MEKNSYREQQREWAVYSKSQASWFNMDAWLLTDEDYLKEIPSEGFTYEECERFIIHQENARDCAVLNIKQPKSLLNFEFKIFEKARKDLAKRQLQETNLAGAKIQQEASMKNQKRQAYMNNYNAWDKMRNDDRTYQTKSVSEVLSERPKLEDYGLTQSDFSPMEKRYISTE